MPTVDERVKTFAGSECHRIDLQLVALYEEVAILRAQIDGKLAQIRELADVHKYWFEVCTGKRDIEGNPTSLKGQSRS